MRRPFRSARSISRRFLHDATAPACPSRLHARYRAGPLLTIGVRDRPRDQTPSITYPPIRSSALRNALLPLPLGATVDNPHNLGNNRQATNNTPWIFGYPLQEGATQCGGRNRREYPVLSKPHTRESSRSRASWLVRAAGNGQTTLRGLFACFPNANERLSFSAPSGTPVASSSNPDRRNCTTLTRRSWREITPRAGRTSSRSTLPTRRASANPRLISSASVVSPYAPSCDVADPAYYDRHTPQHSSSFHGPASQRTGRDDYNGPSPPQIGNRGLREYHAG